MPTAQQRSERVQRARANGAKSRGPKTAVGLHRARTASIKTGLYTTSVSGICPESNEAFLPFHAQLLADWQPQTSQAEILVNQLITVLWDIRLLQNGYTIYMSELVETVAATSPYADDPAKLILEAEKLAVNTYCGTVARFQARLGAGFRTRDRIVRQLLRLEKHPGTSAPSQKSLQINSKPYASLVQPEMVQGAEPERSGATSAPSQKGLKTNGEPYAENVQHQAAPTATLQDDVAGAGHENGHRTSAPSQKVLQINRQPYASLGQPDTVHSAEPEKGGTTSAPSQKVLKTNGEPYAENVQHQAAPAATLQDDVAGAGHESGHRTSEPSQKSLKTNATPNVAVSRPRHQHPARRE